MPNVFRYTLDKLDPILNKCLKFKIPMIALFPCLKNNKKDLLGTEAINENNLICKAIRYIKKDIKILELCVM